jgi:hypothetical protein
MMDLSAGTSSGFVAAAAGNNYVTIAGVTLAAHSYQTTCTVFTN